MIAAACTAGGVPGHCQQQSAIKKMPCMDAAGYSVRDLYISTFDNIRQQQTVQFVK